MLKKTLLKNTKEFLQKNFSENLFLLKKSDKKQKKIVLVKGTVLKKKLLKFKQKNFNLLYQNKTNLSEKYQSFSKSNTSSESQSSSKSNTSSESQFSSKSNTSYHKKSQYLKQAFPIKKHNNFLTSMHMIKSDFEKRQTRNSDFKNKLKEKKKLSILYGNLSNKQIKKTLQQAYKLQGNIANNLLILLESRLDVILYRALFFYSIKSARQWVNCNKVLVNSKYINIASYKTNFGDIISIPPKNKKIVGNNILKFFLYYNLYNENDVIKITSYKHNQFRFNPEKKFVFNLLKTNITIKKNFSFFLIKNNVESKKKLKVNKLKNVYTWKTKISFFTKNLIKALPSLNIINFINKNKIKSTDKILFHEKHRYIISNFYFTLLQNQIKPINKILLKQNINKLTKIFQINDFTLYAQKYQVLNKNNLSSTLLFNNKTIDKVATQLDNPIKSLKWHFFFYKEKLHTRAEILLSTINKKIIKQTKEIINLLLNNKYVHKVERKYYVNNLLNLNSIKYYDILFFLKLKNYFFKKRETLSSGNFKQKINFKPLNLEISYKTLTIIHLFSPQKIVFPCSLDVELLLKSNI